MQGRIKRRRVLHALAQVASSRTEAERPLCPLCGRGIPREQADAHHLIPKSRGGTETVLVHRVCHRQIHALLSEVELERQYGTVEALRSHPEMARFLAWVGSRPADFFPRTRKSQRLKRR